MKEKFFSLVCFIFDSIKVIASLLVILFVFAVAFGIYRSVTILQ